MKSQKEGMVVVDPLFSLNRNHPNLGHMVDTLLKNRIIPSTKNLCFKVRIIHLQKFHIEVFICYTKLKTPSSQVETPPKSPIVYSVLKLP